MRRPGLSRIVQVTAVLIAFGAVVGAVLGAGLAALIGPSLGDFSIHLDVLYAGAEFGIAAGAVLAPLAAWTFMRRVPIWRAIAETGAGTVFGTAVGLVLQPRFDTAWLAPPLLGIAGFTFAAIRLSLRNRASAQRSHIDAQAG